MPESLFSLCLRPGTLLKRDSGTGVFLCLPRVAASAIKVLRSNFLKLFHKRYAARTKFTSH